VTVVKLFQIATPTVFSLSEILILKFMVDFDMLNLDLVCGTAAVEAGRPHCFISLQLHW